MKKNKFKSKLLTKTIHESYCKSCIEFTRKLGEECRCSWKRDPYSRYSYGVKNVDRILSDMIINGDEKEVFADVDIENMRFRIAGSNLCTTIPVELQVKFIEFHKTEITI